MARVLMFAESGVNNLRAMSEGLPWQTEYSLKSAQAIRENLHQDFSDDIL